MLPDACGPTLYYSISLGRADYDETRMREEQQPKKKKTTIIIKFENSSLPARSNHNRGGGNKCYYHHHRDEFVSEIDASETDFRDDLSTRLLLLHSHPRFKKKVF